MIALLLPWFDCRLIDLHRLTFGDLVIGMVDTLRNAHRFLLIFVVLLFRVHLSYRGLYLAGFLGRVDIVLRLLWQILIVLIRSLRLLHHGCIAIFGGLGRLSVLLVIARLVLFLRNDTLFEARSKN